MRYFGLESPRTYSTTQSGTSSLTFKPRVISNIAISLSTVSKLDSDAVIKKAKSEDYKPAAVPWKTQFKSEPGLESN